MDKDQFRVRIIAALIVTVIATPINIFLYDSLAVVVLLTLWLCVGYTRVFGKGPISAPNNELAVKAVVMSLAWPLLPKRG